MNTIDANSSPFVFLTLPSILPVPTIPHFPLSASHSPPSYFISFPPFFQFLLITPIPPLLPIPCNPSCSYFPHIHPLLPIPPIVPIPSFPHTSSYSSFIGLFLLIPPNLPLLFLPSLLILPSYSSPSLLILPSYSSPSLLILPFYSSHPS